jgi:hypothetical protein
LFWRHHGLLSLVIFFADIPQIAGDLIQGCAENLHILSGMFCAARS